jgi:drug/metabolite transporter (DMT)-like permease
MNLIKRLHRVAALLAGLGVAMVAFAGAASASTALIPRPRGEAGPPQTAPIVHTVVVGGMPGWQIALIAIGAALAAAVAAVLLDRLRSTRRPPDTVTA